MKLGEMNMSKYDIKVTLTPSEALNMVKRFQNADLVHDEIHDLGEGKEIGTLVFEKYYMRVGNRVALVVISDNLKGYTGVRVVSTAGAEGFLFNFDWGASESFAESVRDVLSSYIVK